MQRSIDTDALLWSAAATFEELVALGARFVAGEIGRFPGWGAPALDRESDPLRSHLLAFHRAGLLTVASQPGVAGTRDHDGQVRVQRAFVCGFASDDATRKLERLRTDPDIAVGIFRRGAARNDDIPVSARGGVFYAFAGYNAFDEELECFSELCSATALAALEAVSYVSLIDLAWGRADHLFGQAGQALEKT